MRGTYASAGDSFEFRRHRPGSVSIQENRDYKCASSVITCNRGSIEGSLSQQQRYGCICHDVSVGHTSMYSSVPVTI